MNAGCEFSKQKPFLVTAIHTTNKIDFSIEILEKVLVV